MENNGSVVQTELQLVIESTIQSLRHENAAICETSSGRYTYEVLPVPHHKLTAEECDAVRQAKDPILEISIRIGWMYFDAIDATEAQLLQTCKDAVLQTHPEIDNSVIDCRFYEVIEVIPPFSYYLKQAFGSDREA